MGWLMDFHNYYAGAIAGLLFGFAGGMLTAGILAANRIAALTDELWQAQYERKRAYRSVGRPE